MNHNRAHLRGGTLSRSNLPVGLSAVMLLQLFAVAPGQSLLVPMDDAQTDHLKAYGLTYWCLRQPRVYECEWLLNYRCGAFVLPDRPDVRSRADRMGVAIETVTKSTLGGIYAHIETQNMERIVLTKAPTIAVYVPPDAEPWDDAVRLALEYAEVPYDTLWDREVLRGGLSEYDWLHLHHEDFTGQFGKFFATFQHKPWYRRMVMTSRRTAEELGFGSVQKLNAAVAEAIARWVSDGGFLFAMCCAPDTLDISLAARNVDLVPPEIDNTPMHPNPDDHLEFGPTMAFRDFHIVKNPYETEFSDIDVQPQPTQMVSKGDTFTLFEFSAKQDPIATMLNQCHVNAVADFLGQTSAFRRDCLKGGVIVLGDFPGLNKVKYIHGDYGDGTFTFLAGHDPEDYAHIVGEPPPELVRHRHSPGYRLILNNILFPAAKTKEKKT